MSNFFENLEPGEAAEIDLLSRLSYELRENRNVILRSHGVEDEATLLQQIRTGVVDEHPAYEHYLAARILADTRAMVRAVVGERLQEVNRK